jgi:hypothetical protein
MGGYGLYVWGSFGITACRDRRGTLGGPAPAADPNLMKPRTKRALAIVGGLAVLGAPATLVLNAFQSNLVFFFSPTQVASNEAPRDRSFRDRRPGRRRQPRSATRRA